MDDPIGKALNVVPYSTTQVTKVQEPSEQPLSEKDAADFEYARRNLYDVVEVATDALAEFAEIAKQSQHPKFYETLATLINSVTAANRELTEQARKRNAIEAQRKQDEPTTINNNLVLTTKDLQQLLSKRDERDVSGEQES